MSGTATFVKTGDNLVVTYNEGFADVPNYADYVNQIITGMIPTTYSSNTWSLLNDYALSSVVDTNLASLLAANQNQLSYDFTSSADLSSLRLQNGSYTIPVTIASDGNSFTKNVYLTLQGVQTETYIPSDPTVVNWISGISGLVAGTTMNIALVDSSSLSATQLSQIGNLNAIQIFSVSLNGPEQSGVISFSVPQSLVSNPSLVNLYVWDSSSNSWVELGTTYSGSNGLDYLYSASTPHFSLFMIGVSSSTVVTSSLVQLDADIATAQAYVVNSTVGAASGDYSQSSVNALNAAISAAQLITSSNSQVTVDAADSTLESAISTFLSGVVYSPYPYQGGYYGYTPSSATALNSGNGNTNNNVSSQNASSASTNLNKPSGITGGVIGALTSPGGITFLILLVVGVGAVLVIVARRKISKKELASKKK